jgi:hypothetical protein
MNEKTIEETETRSRKKTERHGEAPESEEEKNKKVVKFS